MSDSTTKPSGSLISPMAIPATGRGSGTPASIRASDALHTEAIDDDPFELGDLGDDPDRIGEAVLGRQQRTNRAPGELAMTDLAPSRRSEPPCLARRVWREVVMQEKVLAIVAFERIDDLLVLAGPEGRHRQGLGLAAGKQRRTVGARQNADLARDRSHRSRVAAVDPPPAAQDRAADDFLFDLLEQLQRQGTLGLVGEEFVDLRLGRIETVAAILLALLAIGGFDHRADRFAQPRLDRRFRQLRRQAPRLAGAGLGELDDRLRSPAEIRGGRSITAPSMISSESSFASDSTISTPSAVPATTRSSCEWRHLAECRVQDVVAVDIADARAADGSEERNARDRQSRRSADQARRCRDRFRDHGSERCRSLAFR